MVVSFLRLPYFLCGFQGNQQEHRNSFWGGPWKQNQTMYILKKSASRAFRKPVPQHRTVGAGGEELPGLLEGAEREHLSRRKTARKTARARAAQGSSCNFHFHSFQGSFFLENLRKPRQRSLISHCSFLDCILWACKDLHPQTAASFWFPFKTTKKGVPTSKSDTAVFGIGPPFAFGFLPFICREVNL